MNRFRRRTKASGFATNVKQIGFHINWERSRSHVPENQKLWDFHVFKVNGDKLVKLTYGKFPTGEYWFTSPDDDENENVFFYIRRKDDAGAYNDEEGMNGTYVIWNSADRKGYILDVLEGTESIPMVDYNQFVSMPIQPYMAKVDVRVSGRVDQLLTLELLREDESPLVEKIGGARRRRTRNREALDPVFNPTISASFLATKSPIKVYADIKTEESSFSVNNGNLIILEGTSEAKKKKSFNVSMTKILEESEPIEEETSETQEVEEEETEEEVVEENTSAQQREMERIVQENAARAASEQAAQLALQQQAEEEEKKDRYMKIGAATIAVIGAAFIIYKKTSKKKEATE